VDALRRQLLLTTTINVVRVCGRAENAFVEFYVIIITWEWVDLEMIQKNSDQRHCTSKDMWEILVPTIRQDGRPFHLRYHKKWDEMVRSISGGLTILTPVKGQWIFEDKLFNERMIPVRIISTRAEILEIVAMTKKYYEQIAVLAYRLSDDVILRHDNETQNIG